MQCYSHAMIGGFGKEKGTKLLPRNNTCFYQAFRGVKFA